MPKKVEEIYKKKNLHQHILDRPDSYIGSTKLTTEERFVFDNKTKKITKKIVEYNPGLIKIFDEILVNAIDHTVREKNAKTIKVDIDEKSGEISVFNDGPGVPVVLHKEYNVYIPELIFGNLLTSSNYDDTQQRIVGGVNGLGSKCTNIFSKKFVIETIDAKQKMFYKQEFSENMFKKMEPEIKKTSEKSFTKITFLPDYERFGMKKLTKDTMSILMKRVYDTTACTNKDVSVYLNDKKLGAKDFISYISMYTDEKVITEKFAEGEMVWEVGVYFTEKPGQVSFVNGIDTYNGGKHVESVLNQIVKKLTTLLETKKKMNDVKPSYIKDRIFLFVRSTIVNPSFTSQSKEYLTTNIKDFGIKVELGENFITKVYKSGIVEDLLSFVKYKNDKALAKVDKTSRKTKLNIPKLDDANFAGTNKSKNCTLILTEGDSAKTFAVSGMSIIGRDYYGIFALKGKVLNVREATQQQLLKNEEINNLKKIIGLQHGKKYESVESLRYGKIMLLTDADFDGIHITGLIMNFFHTWWPDLLEIPGFLINMRTPIIKSIKGKETIEFYSQNDYNEWKKDIDSKKWNVKYYKGLGTSTASEAKDIFKKLDKNKVNYISDSEDKTKKAILLAFEKKKADDRKRWLQKIRPEEILDFNKKNITYDDFINKELVQFSLSDIARSIPSIYDGLKPSQRKVLYTLFKKNYQKEIKVAQFGAAVAETTAYHHGEASLFSTIINMAQDYVGSNNINLLKPNGQFGCLDPDTEVMKFSGESIKAKDVKIGDFLMGDDGFQRKVKAITCGVDHMYKVSFSNGKSVVVNSEHILTFKIKCHKMIKYLPHKMAWLFTYFDRDTKTMKFIDFTDDNFNHSIKDLKEREIFIKDYIRQTFTQVRNCDIFDIKVSDYLKIDDETKKFMFAIEANTVLHFNNEKIHFNEYDYGLSLKNYVGKIPDVYKLSGYKQRFNIMKGFFHSFKDCVYIYDDYFVVETGVLLEDLINDLIFIMRSIGIYCYREELTIVVKGKGIYSLLNYYNSDILLHTIKNKPIQLSITVESIGFGKFNGWELSGNKRFLLSNFVITHNSRISNGKDAASPRYIFTEINDITKKIFNPLDFNVIKYLDDDGTQIEPEYYVPIIPVILVNGTQGIGTGFSTFIPCYNIVDIVENMKLYVDGKKMKEMNPYYNGFKGKISKNTKEKSYIIYGNYKKISSDTLKITELPIGTSIEESVDYIKALVDDGSFLRDYTNNSTDKEVDIDVVFKDTKILDSYLKNQDLVYKNLKLTKTISTNNMHLFDKTNKIKKYEDPLEILKEFMEIRLLYNEKRRKYLIEMYTKNLKVLDAKIRFIEEIIKGSLVVYKQKKEKIIEMLVEKKYEKVDSSYDYLLSLPIYSFTLEKINELKTKHQKNKQDLEEVKNKTEKAMLLDDIKEI